MYPHLKEQHELNESGNQRGVVRFDGRDPAIDGPHAEERDPERENEATGFMPKPVRFLDEWKDVADSHVANPSKMGAKPQGFQSEISP